MTTALMPQTSTDVIATGHWTLAIDFGTTYTVAAVASPEPGSARLIDLEGDGASKMPSSVVVTDDGEIVVGRAAVRQAALYPAAFEATPKRLIGQRTVLLGQRLVPVVELIAAVLRHASDEARRQCGGTVPALVRLTHPAKWSGPRLEVLRDAARIAGLGEVELVAEPVAAATRIGTAMVAVGERIAVYDFGGGTFDAAVLVRTATGFSVAGDPGGRDPLGGEDIDDRILAHLGAGPLGAHADWAALAGSAEPSWRRQRAELRRRVRDAKEDLARSLAATLWIPGLECDYQLSRAELDALIEADVAQTVDELAATIAAADCTPEDLAGIYLVGGSSRLCLVRELLRERFGVEPAHFEDPKAIVALGGAGLPALTGPVGAAGASIASCRLGFDAARAQPGLRRVEHWLSVDNGATYLYSVPNQWPSTAAYAAFAQHQAHRHGDQVDEPQWGPSLGLDGAIHLRRTDAGGSTRTSTYQVVDGWAIESTTAHGPESFDGFTAFGTASAVAPASRPSPPIAVSPDRRAELVETLRLTSYVAGLPVEATIMAANEPNADGDPTRWLDLFLARQIARLPGLSAEALPDGTFGPGAPCRVARLRGRGYRAWVWYGIVDGRGVSITVSCALPLPYKTALRLRDAAILLP
jgi:Ethanolamine utilization protein EutJ (predicted chaperonin)